MAKKDPLKIIGIIILVISGIIFVSAVPIVEQSAIAFGPIKATGISPVSATRMMIGIIGIILGIVVYLGKEGFKILTRR